MPPDSLRSRIYKSFLTCNDPKGIVDKSTVRKKKAVPSEMEKRITSRAARKNFSDFSDCKLRREESVIKEVVDEFSSSSSCPLMEVSTGAQKLNRTIDLWSNGMKYDSHSEEIARDLFEGAIDLQQSLVILGTLQEASRYMTPVKKKEHIERRATENEFLFFDNRESEFHTTTYLEAPAHVPRPRRGRQQGILKLSSLVGLEPETFKGAYLRDPKSLPTRPSLRDTGNEFHKPRLSADYSYGDGTEELKKAIRDRLARQLFPNTTNMAERISFPENSMENSASDFASTSSSQSSIGNNTTAIPAKKGNGRNLIAKLMGLELQQKQMHETLDKQFPDPRRPKLSTEMNEAKKPKSVTHEIAKRTSESNLNNQQFKGIFKHSAKEVDDYFNYSSNSNSREKFTHTAPPIVLLKPLRVSKVEWDERQAQVFEEDEALNNKRFMKLKMKEKHPQQKNDSKVKVISSKRVLGSIGVQETSISRINHRKEAQNPKEHNWKPKECINFIKPKKRISNIPLDQNLQRKEAIDRKVLESQKEIVARKNQLSQAKIVPKFQNQVQGSLSKLQDSTPTSDTASKSSPFSTNQAIVEKVINEVSVEKLEAIDFGGKSNVKKPDQTYSPASLLNMKEKAGSSRHQTCEYCIESQSSLIHACCTTESSKYIDHEISLTKPGTIPKAPISSNPRPSSHTNKLFNLNANGSSRIWISPEESPPIACHSMESLRNYRKINEATNEILGLNWWWPIRESMKEAEEVVEDLEERILVGLIQEVFV